MSQTDRLSTIARMLDDGMILTAKALQERFEVSRPTVMRDIEYLRDRMNVPVTYDMERRGYVVERPGPMDPAPIPFPGMWLTKDEAYALLTLFNITSRLDPGVFRHFMAPLIKPLKRVLGDEGYPMMGFDRKIKIELPFVTARKVNQGVFAVVEQALLLNKSISFSAQDGNGEIVKRSGRPVALALTLEGWAVEMVTAESPDKVATRYALSAIVAAATEIQPTAASTRRP